MSAATSAGAFCSSFSRRASLAAVVVFPDPCNPTRRMTVGPTEANSSPAFVPPSSVAISSCINLTTCWPGLTALTCSTPTARSRTRSTTPRVTSKLTSASSRWRRISRSASVTSLSESTPRPRSRCNTPVICSARAVNISQAKYLASCRNPSGGLNASWRYPNRGNRPPAGPSRRRVHQPHPGAAIDGESVDPRPATPRRPSAPPTRPGPLKPPRETGGGGRVGPHRVPDQRVRPLFRREHAVAVAVPTTGELGRLCLGRITKELLEEQSDLELAQIVLVTHGTVAP